MLNYNNFLDNLIESLDQKLDTFMYKIHSQLIVSCMLSMFGSACCALMLKVQKAAERSFLLKSGEALGN